MDSVVHHGWEEVTGVEDSETYSGQRDHPVRRLVPICIMEGFKRYIQAIEDQEVLLVAHEWVAPSACHLWKTEAAYQHL